MKSTSKALMALAVAGTFAAGGAFAGGGKHSGHFGTHEVQTPMSVNESSPWLANERHGAGWTQQSGHAVIGMNEGLHSDGPVGTGSSLSASGSGGFDSSMTGLDYSLSGTSGVEYWLLGDEPRGTSSSLGGSGEGSFDSMSSLGADSFAMGDEYYLVSGPLATFDGEHYILFDSGTSGEDLAYLGTLSEDFWVLSPIYDDMADSSAFTFEGSESDRLTQYSPLGSDEDIAT